MTTTPLRFRKTAIAVLLASLAAVPAFAQVSAARDAADVQRDVSQQQRIDAGLKSGQLTTKEASKLEAKETHIEKLEAHADANGHISAAEQKRIDADQQRLSKEIHADKTNDKTGNPDSLSSQRMQRDVAADVNQQKRIEGGIQSGSLSTKEAGSLERGQAHDTRLQAEAAANGHIHSNEEAKIAHADENQSKRIHNAKTRK